MVTKINDLRHLAQFIDESLSDWLVLHPTDKEGRYEDAIKYVTGQVMQLTKGHIDPKLAACIVRLHRVVWNDSRHSLPV